MYFPVSGVEANPLVLLLVAFAVSAVTAPAGISGAFLLLPFQVSVLGFAGPAASSTNLVYNIGATPGGIYRYIREGRMLWPLAWAIVLGTLPGVFIGAMLRVSYLSEPGPFKVFAGFVLLYLGARLLYETAVQFAEVPRKERHDLYHAGLDFNKPVVFLLSLAVGVIGGIYGVGGAAIIAPFFVTGLGLPMRAVTGAAMLGTFATSVAGVTFFQTLAIADPGSGPAAAPDWLLGGVLAAGGLAGTYAGARAQKFLPEPLIKALLGALVLALATSYLLGALFGG